MGSLTTRWDELEKLRTRLSDFNDDANRQRAVIFDRQRKLRKLEAKMRLLRSEIEAMVEAGFDA